MEIYPAIDLQAGKCVRLRQGDLSAPSIYSNDPAQVARNFKLAGSRWIHVVDLDATVSGFGANRAGLADILGVGLKIQTGGGIRSIDHAHALLAMGVSRIVIGTAAVEDVHLLDEFVSHCDDSLAVSVDVREDRVAVRGWRSTSALLMNDFLVRLQTHRVGRIIYTDISRDGMLAGPNLERLGAVCRDFEFEVIASGGVTTVEDVAALKALGADGVIIGKALYEGRVRLEDALAVAADTLGN